MFSGINSAIQPQTGEAQLKQVGELVRSASVIVYEKAKQTDSEITYTLNIPKQLSACEYKMQFGSKIKVSCSDESINSELSLYGIAVEPSQIYSSRGYIKIIATKNDLRFE